MPDMAEFTREETAKLRALVSNKTFKYSHKNYSCEVTQELSQEELADWKRRIDKK